MEELAMCRVCLAEDVRLRFIANTHLQEMYESLTSLPLETKDSRPIRACYICCAGLQNCYRLKKRCLQSEEQLTRILSSDVLQPINVQEGCTQRLKIEHPVIHLSIDDVVQNNADDDTTEASAHRTEATDVVHHYIVEQEDIEDIKVEPLEEHDAQIDDDIQSSHLEDPLDVMKREPDAVETENELDDTGSPSQSANNICPKIVKVVSEKMVLNDTKPATGVPALKKLEETEQECENVNKSDVVEKLMCDICNKCFTFQSILTRHMYTHTGEKPFHCNVCNKRFTHKYNLTRHMYTHTGEKPLHCDVCNKRFTLKSNLMQHKLTHTGHKPYVCEVCKKSFFQKAQLTEHLFIHTGEKQFQCDLCNKCFWSKTKLLRHMLSHIGEKWFECDMCNKHFTLRSNLIAHMYTHTGEKRFQCGLCNKCFWTNSKLTRHMYTH